MSKVSLRLDFTFDRESLLAFLLNEGTLSGMVEDSAEEIAANYISEVIYDALCGDFSSVKYDGKTTIIKDGE